MLQKWGRYVRPSNITICNTSKALLLKCPSYPTSFHASIPRNQWCLQCFQCTHPQTFQVCKVFIALILKHLGLAAILVPRNIGFCYVIQNPTFYNFCAFSKRVSNILFLCTLPQPSHFLQCSQCHLALSIEDFIKFFECRYSPKCPCFAACQSLFLKTLRFCNVFSALILEPRFGNDFWGFQLKIQQSGRVRPLP